MPGPGIMINEAPVGSGPTVPQFAGNYWPNMPLDMFEDAFYEVAEPLFTWVRDNWVGTWADKPRLEAQLNQWWQIAQVPSYHPVRGVRLEIDPHNPQHATLSFQVDSQYALLHQEMVDTRPNRLTTIPVFEKELDFHISNARKRRLARKRDPHNGWKDDPLDL